LDEKSKCPVQILRSAKMSFYYCVHCEQAFLIAACEHEIWQGANTEATEQFESRVAATLTNLAKQVQGLLTLAHSRVALSDVFLKYVHG
jgi:hypothetical protein